MLIDAVERGSLDEVEAILAEGTTSQPVCDVCLQLAIKSERADLVAALLRHPSGRPDAVLSEATVDAFPHLALHYDLPPMRLAAQLHLPEIVRILHDFGGDVNARGPGGITALHCAVDREGCLASEVRGAVPDGTLTRLLLALGADPDATADDGATPRRSAELYEHREALRLLDACSAVKRGDCRLLRAQTTWSGYDPVVYVLQKWLAPDQSQVVQGQNLGVCYYEEEKASTDLGAWAPCAGRLRHLVDEGASIFYNQILGALYLDR